MKLSPDMSQTEANNVVPSSYSEDWLEQLDGRTRVARILRERMTTLSTDLGGWDTLSYQRRSLVKRCIHMEAIVEQQEAALASGKDVDLGKLTQSVNSLIGLLKTLGLERKAREIPDLKSYLAEAG